MEHRIVKAEVRGPGKLALQFSGQAETHVAELGELIMRGNAYARLADVDYLAQFELMYEGLFLQWPDDFDISAERLWELSTLPAKNGSRPNSAAATKPVTVKAN
jgi:hypothetical protein